MHFLLRHLNNNLSKKLRFVLRATYEVIEMVWDFCTGHGIVNADPISCNSTKRKLGQRRPPWCPKYYPVKMWQGFFHVFLTVVWSKMHQIWWKYHHFLIFLLEFDVKLIIFLANAMEIPWLELVQNPCHIWAWTTN